MKLLLIVICFAIAGIGYLLDRKIYGPTGFLGLFFGVIMLFTYFKPYPLYDTTDAPYIIITIGVASFFAGACISRFYTPHFKIKHSFHRDYNGIDINKYNLCIIIITATFFPYIFNTVRYIFSGHSIGELYYTFAASRYHHDITLQIPYFWNLLNEFIGKPIGCMIIPLSLVLYHIKNQKKYLFISLYTTILFVMIGFQRTYIVYFVLYLVLLSTLSSKRDKKNREIYNWIKKNKRKTIFLITIATLFFVVVSMSRLAVYGNSFNPIRTIYYYYCICINLMDNWLKQAQDGRWIYTHGMFSFRGFFSPFVSIIQRFGVSVPTMDHVDEYLTKISSTVYVNSFTGRNSYVTIFFAFFIDGGKTAVVILSSVFGFIAHRLFYRVKNNATIYSITCYIMFFVLILCFSMVNCNLLQISIFWAFVIIRFMFVPKRNRRYE